jgi:hypothetical protein
MDGVNSIAKRLHQNLLSVAKRPTSPSSGQFSSSLAAGGAPVSLSSRFESGAVTSGTTLKLHELFIVSDSKVGASGGVLCYTCIGHNGVFCLKEGCELGHHGSGACNPEVGDIHILSKQGEVFIQPKINVRDISDDLAAEWLRSKESVQDWTTKFGLVNSADHSTTISPEDMEASEVFSNFAENWKTPAKLGRRQLAIPERILPSFEDDFAFVKNLPDDTAELIVQLGWDPQRGGRIVRAIGNIESALETSKGATQTTFEIINDSLVAGKTLRGEADALFVQ